MASSASAIFDAIDLGIPIPICYGPIRGVGNVAAQFEKADKTILRAYLQGEGPWNALTRLFINRKAIALPDTTKVRFHPGNDGEIGAGMAATSTGGDQKVDSFFAEFPGATNFVTWSRYCYLFVKFAPDPGAPSADPEILADFEALKVRIFNSSGVQTGFAYSDNPVRWWTDYVIRKFILPFGKVNQPLTTQELARFDWGLIDAAATHSDFDIGGGVKRWSGGGLVLGGNESNQGMTADQALEQLHLMCNSYALEINGKVSINPNKSRASVFTFKLDHILPGSFRVREPEVRFNQIVPRFRDIDLASGSTDNASRFTEATPEPMNHEAHQREAGFTARGMARQRKVLQPLVLDYGNNTPERVWRGARSLLLQELGDEPDPGNAYHLPEEAEWDATEDTLAVIPGDVITVDKGVSEEHGGADYEVLRVVENPSATRHIAARKFNTNAFPDVAPSQQQSEAPAPGTGLPPAGAPDTAPGAPTALDLSGSGQGEFIFTWSAPAGAISPEQLAYEVQIASDAGFTANLETFTSLNVTAITIHKSNVSRFWRVRAKYPNSPFGVYATFGAPTAVASGLVAVGTDTSGNLDNLGDGSSRRARTVSHSVYRPLTNPLAATDAGASATVNIAAFTMRYSGVDIAYNSGSITALSFGTLYFIYVDDASFVGGAVTYNATTTRETSLNNPGRLFVGSLLTPVDGGADTAGNNDGGSGTAGSKFVTQIFPPGSFTWTKPAGAQQVEVLLIGSGGGGGSGRRGAEGGTRGGGGGGGGGGISRNLFQANFLGATESVVVGSVGTGGAGVTTDNTNGNAGASGGATSFGNYLKAGGGAGGGGGTDSAHGAGGAGGVGNFGAGGAGGGGGTQGAGNPGAAPGTTSMAAGGSGCGGQPNLGGGVGGAGSPVHNTTLTGGAAGAPTGGAGGSGTPPLEHEFIGGPGGGGGAGGDSSNTLVAGGAGGSPTRYGGGGGGGGGVGNQGTGNSVSSGAGANGAPGIAIVTTYF